MTNHWIDIRNADRILIIGSNAAENHPISFKWVTKAKERGGILISVDPRFTRTSSRADIYAPIRSGTDITFIGGIVRYILDEFQKLGAGNRKNSDKYNWTYITEYTNAALTIDNAFEGAFEGDPGIFSGFTANGDPAPGTLGTYNKASWAYGNKVQPNADAAVIDDTWSSWSDLNPKTVLRLLWENYQQYDADTVAAVTGCPKDKFLEVARVYAESGAPGKAGTIMYAMGTTQHTYGTQNIRGYAIMQLLLANIGVAGGGINALRGTSNVQGSTDMCLLEHILPGYMATPVYTDQSLNDYIVRTGKLPITPDGLYPDLATQPASLNWWGVKTVGDGSTQPTYDDTVPGHATPNVKKYIVSLLKAWWGDKATAANDFCFNYLGKKPASGNFTHIGLFEGIADGTVKGLMCWGQNPLVGGPDSEGEREAMKNLDWLMVADLFETETAAFFKRPDPTVTQDPDNPTLVNSSAINTEVFLLPAACSYEKQGSISNSGRWAQWRYKAIDPIGEAKPDLEIVNLLVKKLKDLYAADATAPLREAILDLHWGYESYGEYAQEADPNVVSKEINGYDWATGSVKTSFGQLAADGTTCSGNWLYCGQWAGNDPDKDNKAKWHDNRDYSLTQIGLYSKFTWCWPINRRIIYNRASVNLDGVPWDREHAVVIWDDTSKAWLTQGDLIDVLDGGAAPINGGGYLPFIMHKEGVAHIWGPGRADGPLPVAYEPWESPLTENIITRVGNNGSFKGEPGFNDPTCYVGWLNDHNKKGSADEFPHVGMTYRVSEMWQAGQMTRNLPWLNELQPSVFAELDPELAGALDIESGDVVKVETARGYVIAVAIVTRRFQPLNIGGPVGGKVVHQVGVPWHWGYTGWSSSKIGHAAGNILTPHVGDANTTIPEFKTFLCNIRLHEKRK